MRRMLPLLCGRCKRARSSFPSLAACNTQPPCVLSLLLRHLLAALPGSAIHEWLSVRQQHQRLRRLLHSGLQVRGLVRGASGLVRSASRAQHNMRGSQPHIAAQACPREGVGWGCARVVGSQQALLPPAPRRQCGEVTAASVVTVGILVLTGATFGEVSAVHIRAAPQPTGLVGAHH